MPRGVTGSCQNMALTPTVNTGNRVILDGEVKCDSALGLLVSHSGLHGVECSTRLSGLLFLRRVYDYLLTDTNKK